MELRCTQRLTQTQKLELSQRLTLTQRILVQDHVLSLRLELIGSIREELYEPKGECPKCCKKLTPLEVIKGFNRNPTDFTTECPSCGYRFNPEIICSGKGSVTHLPFYCAAQALHHLKGYENLPPNRLSRDHPGVFRSAIIHFGSLKKAFKEIGINYQFEEIDSSAEKIIPFLGKLPDVDIAECSGVPIYRVRMMRKKLHITRFSNRKVLNEITD